MAPVKGVNVRETSNGSRSHLSMTSMLSWLKRLCGAPSEHSAQATPGPSRRALRQQQHKAGVSIPSGDTTAPGLDTFDNHVGLNGSAALNSQGPGTGGMEDVTLSCTDSRILEAKAEHPPWLLAPLPLGGTPGNLASQRLSPLNVEVDTASTAAVVSLYHYCHSSYALNAPTLTSVSSNCQAPVQPETYIDLPQVSSSPPLLSPIPLGPPVSRRLLGPPPAAGSAGAPADDLLSVATSPSIPKVVLRSDAMQMPDVKAQVGQSHEAAEASIATVMAATTAATQAVIPPLYPLVAPGAQLRQGSSLPLPELPGAAHSLRPASEHSRGAEWRFAAHASSAPLQFLQPPQQPGRVSPGTEDTSLLFQQHTERPAFFMHRDQPSQYTDARELTRSVGSRGGIPATSPEFNAVAAAAALATAAAAAAAAAAAKATAAAAAVPASAFTMAGIGSPGAQRAQQSINGTMSYGYGNCGLGCGFLDAPSLLADGRSAPCSGHISGIYSPRPASFQDGGVGNISAGASYTQPPPSPPRSSVGLMVPSRVSVSGAGSVLSLPIETSSLFDVTVPRTGLLPEQTALEMSMQAPVLDLWAAAEHVSLISRISQGAYGVVYRGLWHGCTCAVKLMLAASTENLSSQLTEVFLCKALSCHPNIVQTFDCNVWRITSDTLQAVRSLCSGSAFASPYANAIRGFSGSPGTGALPTDSPAPPGAMLIQSAASGWLGPSPSTLLSGAPSAVPSPCSFLGTNGMGVLVAASSTNSLDRQPGVLPGPGSTCEMAPEMAASANRAAAAAAAAVFRQEVPSSAPEPWGTTHGGAAACEPHLGSGLCQEQQRRPAAATLAATAEPAVVSRAPSEVNGRSLGAPPADRAVLQQGKAGEPLPLQEAGDAGTLGGENTVLRAAALPLRSTEVTPSQSSASLQVPRMLQHELPQNEGQEVANNGVVPMGQPSPQLPLLIRALGPVLEERHAVKLNCSGILPNLSPAVSLPPSQPLSSSVACISHDASELMTPSQSRLPQPLRGSRAGSGLEVVAGQHSISGYQQTSTCPRCPRSCSPPPPQRPLPGTDLGEGKPGQEPHQEMLQQQQPVPTAEDAGIQAQSVGRDTMPLAQSVGCESTGNEMHLRQCETAVASGRAPLLPSDPAARGNATRPAPEEPAAVSTGEAAVRPAHVLSGSNHRVVQSGGSGLRIGAVRAAEFTSSSLGGAGGGTPNPASLSQSPSSTCAANADSSGGAAGLAAGFFSCNPCHIFLDGRWPSPDASSRSPSPALALSSNPSPKPGSAIPGVTTVAARAAAAGSLGARAASGGTATIPVSAAQVALSMGMNSGLAAAMSMGFCSSPLSSGMLPTSLQPGIVSRTTRQLSDRAITLPSVGLSGGSGLHGMAAPWPLQTRSAVATGDEGDAAAAMAGARNLAQVLNLLGARDCQLAVVVVMEECDRGSLQQLLSKAAAAAAAVTSPQDGGTQQNLYVPFSGGGRYTPAAALRALTLTAREVALGMAFLHHNNIIHGDLKPGNVLLKSSRQDQRGFVVKISDFGLSRVLHSNGGPHSHLLATGASSSGSIGSVCAGAEGEGQIMGGALDGTVPYLAPELINNGQRSKASDVWAYGVLLWQLVTGLRPFDGLTQWQIMAAVSAGEQLLNWPVEAHPALVHLGRACLAYNPRDRPNFAQIVRRLQALEADLLRTEES